jgi:formate hydrogenlyase transcriptional activator
MEPMDSAARPSSNAAPDRSELLLAVNNALVSNLDLGQLMKEISNCLRRELPHDYSGIALYDPERNVLRIQALESPPGKQFFEMWQELPVESTPPGLAFTSRKPVLRARIDTNEFPGTADLVKNGIAAGLAVPLICQGKALGAMGVLSFQEGAFNEQDAELLTQIGIQVALAVQNALHFQQLQAAEKEVARERDRSTLLLEINNAVVSNLDLRELLKSISASLRRIIPHEGAFLTLFNPERTRLRVQALDLQPQDKVPFEEGVTIELPGTPEGEAIASRKPVLVIPVIDVDRFFSPWVQRALENGVRSGCAVPLIAHGRPLGALSVVSLREAAFNEEDAELLQQCSNQIAIAVENALAYREIEAVKNKLSQEKVYLEDEIRNELNFEEIIGQSPALRKVLQMVQTVSASDSTVLILGETGTGKELIARAIHNLSSRHERTMVKINCAAIPMGLLESELFGHEKGAFTGAIAQRIGRFELANRGTLFLDEVGDIPLELQPKLLRVLQEQQFERLGSTRTQQVDVRLVAATNCDLGKMVADKQFRSDLYYRLNVFPITIPPLRERPEDIPLLARFFADRFSRRMKKPIESIPAKAIAVLSQYRWPGNVRELENVIERAVILSRGTELEIPMGELRTAAAPIVVVPAVREPEKQPASGTLESVERDHILRVLEETRWVIAGPGGAAARLGMKRTTLQAKMRKLGLSRRG